MQRIARDKLVQVRLSTEELTAIQGMAIAGDESVSQLLRRLAREEQARREARR